MVTIRYVVQCVKAGLEVGECWSARVALEVGHNFGRGAGSALQRSGRQDGVEMHLTKAVRSKLAQFDTMIA